MLDSLCQAVWLSWRFLAASVMRGPVVSQPGTDDKDTEHLQVASLRASLWSIRTVVFSGRPGEDGLC